MMKYLALASVALSLLAPLSASCSDVPPVVDPKKIAITLERSVCFGSCPAYKATIHGDGRVQFTADKNPFGTASAAREQFAYSEGVLLRGSYEDRGAPLDRLVYVSGGLPMSPTAKPEIAGILLIESAIRRGHADLFKRLATSGWLDRLGKRKAGEIFSQYAAGCSPAMVDAVADAGVNIDEATQPKLGDKLDDNPGGPYGKTALAELATSYICGKDEISRVQTADALL